METPKIFKLRIIGLLPVIPAGVRYSSRTIWAYLALDFEKNNVRRQLHNERYR